jgi:putative addiction module CopG family antidote
MLHVMATKRITISLTNDLQKSIDHRVRSGMYTDASDVVRAALRALTREENARSVEEFDRSATGPNYTGNRAGN